jgi:hypothetical protein
MEGVEPSPFRNHAVLMQQSSANKQAEEPSEASSTPSLARSAGEGWGGVLFAASQQIKHPKLRG